MAHGLGGLKEFDLDVFAEHFTSKLPLACLIYDNRGWGASDTLPGQPRRETIPAAQISDYSDAITYAQTLPEVDPERIGVWGSSYSGGHVLVVGATDRRAKCVVSQM
jgi:cephalosporin-C deacetylase-like acetyl esterase